METTTTTTTKKVQQAPVERVSLPVKPALATAANGAALAAAGVVAGGGVAMAAAAAAALGVGAAVKGGKKLQQQRTQRKAFSTAGSSTARRGGTTGVGSSGARGNGKAGSVGKTATKAPLSGAARGLAGAGKTGSGPGAGRSGLAGGRSAAGSGSGRSGLLGRGTGRSAGQTGSGRSAGGSRSGGGMAGRMAHRARSMAHSPATRWAAGKARASWAQTKAAAAQTGVRTAAARKKVWGWLRKLIQRHIMGRTPEAQTKPVPTALVAGSLKDAFEKGLLNDLINPDRRTIVRPINRGGQTAVDHHAPEGAGMLPDMLRQVHQFATEYDAPGVLEIIHDLDQGNLSLAQSVQLFAQAFDVLADTCQKRWPFDDAIVQKFKMISECLNTAASMCKGIVPDIETIHEAELRRLRNPGVGQEKFDLSANGYV